MNDCKFIELDNGLTIIMYSDKTKINNHAELLTFFGGLNHTYCGNNNKIKKIKPGTAHFLEHYICENSKYGNLIDNLYDKKVIDANAGTNGEFTKFYFNTAYNFEECLELFLNSIYSVSFATERVDKTKPAIYSEIRDDMDSISAKIYRAKLKINFSESTMTLGTKSSISSINYKYLEEVYKDFYVPKNQLIVLAGPFDENKVLNQIKRIYAKYKFIHNCRKRLENDSDKVYTKEKTITGSNLNEVIISYKIKTNNISNFDRYKLDWYLNAFININFSRFSTLNETLQNKSLITGDLSCCIYNLKGYAIVEVLAYTNRKKEFIKLVNETINNNEDKRKEFALSKKSSLLRLSVRKDFLSSFVAPVIDNYIEFDYLQNDTLEFVESLNYDEYQKIIKKINFSNYSVLIVKKYQ